MSKPVRILGLNPRGRSPRAIAARSAMLQYAVVIRSERRAVSDRICRWAMREALDAQAAAQ